MSLSLRPLLSLAGFGSALIAPAGALAATAPPVALDPVVVTSTSPREPLVVALDPKAPMQPIPAQDGAQVLQHVPGFALIRKGGTDGDPVFRGLAGSRLGIQVDGEGLLGGCGHRMDPPTAYVYPAAFDRVVIVKGPQTVRFGPGTTAGVVRFERETAPLAATGTTAYASVTAGSFGRREAAVDARAGTERAHARVTATAARSADAEDGDGRALPSAYERWSTQAGLVWTPDAHTVLELTAIRSDGEAAYADRAMDGVAFTRDNLGLRFRRREPTPLVASVELQVFDNRIDHVMDNFSLRAFVPTPMMPGRTVSNPDRATAGGRAELVLTPGPRWRITAGLDHQTNCHRVRTTSDEAAMPYRSRPRLTDAVFQQTGAYAEAVRALDEKARRRLLLGARADAWTATDRRERIATGMMGTMPNPTAGQRRSSVLPAGFVRFEHDAQPDFANTPLTLYAGLGHAQRFPDYWELFNKESVDSVSAFGRSPERHTQLDVGALYRGPVLELSVALFAAEIHDYLLVQTGVLKPAGMGRTRNATVTRNVQVFTRGGELSLGWRLTEAWRLEASLAAVHGENDTDRRPLAQQPPLESRLTATYSRPTWSASALVRAVAAQDRVAPSQGNIVGQDLGPSPGFAVFAVNAAWRPTPAVRIAAGIDNLFDRTYAEHLSRAGASVAGYEQTTRVNEPGRFFWLKVDYSH